MKKTGEKILFEGQWISLCEISYTSKTGKELTWETVRRKKSSVGVVVVARLMPSKRFILIKQYRPAINGYILAFPAGLAFDDPQHALVELKEETGYTGVIKNISPVLSAGASLIDDKGRVIYIEVDENTPENKNPQQELEPSEDIEVKLVEDHHMHDFILSQSQAGTHIASNLWYMFGLRSII